MNLPRLLIAGTHSGVGKTTVAAGLMAALARRGIPVAPFKVGPDYLDPGYHAAACGRASAPLDTWMLGEAGALRSLARGARAAGLPGAPAVVAVVEGMMGLHDGAEPEGDRGSTAEVARLLQLPVVLVLDGSALARSAGAVALGYRLFDPEVPLRGVIANRIAGEGHARYLRPAIELQAGLPLLGCLPPAPDAVIPERHLGLVGAGERAETRELIARLADLVEAHVDLERLLELARSAPPLELSESLAAPPSPERAAPVRIAVARDSAFCFYYPDNLSLLEAAGAELVPFSPLEDRELPAGARGLYLGGGYPELHAARLSANEGMLQAIRELARRGAPIYAECGGYMYLCERLIDSQGREHAGVGLIPGRCRMESRLQAIGYREVTCLSETVLGGPWTVLRGHEFHHSRFEGEEPPERAAFACGGRRHGFAERNLLASYIHLHFGSNPAAAETFVRKCREHGSPGASAPVPEEPRPPLLLPG